MARPRKASTIRAQSQQRGTRHVLPIRRGAFVGPVGPAGVLKPITCPTQSTDAYGFLFLVKYGEHGVLYLDRCADVSRVLGMQWHGVLAAEKLTGDRNYSARGIISSYKEMQLRVRLNGNACGPYLVKFEEPTTSTVLENFLRSLSPTDRKSFLKGAAI